MTKKQLALEVIDILKNEYCDCQCSLIYYEPWQLLVAVRLAAQCTDARVNIVTKDLFEKYPTLEELARADYIEVEQIVRPCGFGKTKAKDICDCTRQLVEIYDKKIPDDFDKLLMLPGIGRKSANLIMGDIFHKPAIVADTHCIRLSNRIGLVKNEKNPKKVEMSLWKIVPPNEGNDLCHRFVEHGRRVCTAKNPKCDKCCLKNCCKKQIL